MTGLSPFLAAGAAQDSDSPALQIVLGLGFALAGLLIGLFPDRLHLTRSRPVATADRKGVARVYYWLAFRGTALVFVGAGLVMVVLGISRLLSR